LKYSGSRTAGGHNIGEERLFPLEIFRRNIVFWSFVRFHFATIRVRSVFDAADHFGFVVLTLFGKLRDALSDSDNP
jgi:hypothetical protein